MNGIEGKQWKRRSVPATVIRAVAMTLCVFSIALGSKWHISSIRIKGNRAFSANQLVRAMETKTSHFWSESLFFQSKVHADIETLTGLYRQKGFLDVVVTLASVERDTSEHTVAITLDIAEGPQTLVDSVVVASIRVLSDSAVRSIIATKAGGPLGRRVIENDVQLLIDTLGGRGYLYARVEEFVMIDSIRHRGNVTFSIDPGPIVVAGVIDVAGERKVRSKVVHKSLAFKSGEILTSRSIRASVERLYRTGLFTFVLIEPSLENVTESERRRDTITESVSVGVREAHFFSIDAAIGYQSFERFRGSMLVRYGNLFGIGHAVAFNGNISRLQQAATVTYSLPSLFSLPIYVDISPYVEHHDVTYRGLFDGVLFSVGQEINWYLTYRFFAKWERVEYVQADSAIVQSRPNTQSIGFDMVFDSRKGVRDTAMGIQMRCSPEFAGLGGSGSNQYYRVLVDARGYYNPVRWLSFSSAINTGYARGFGVNDAGVPAQALYYPGIGGMRQVRGYTNDSIGGKLLLIFNPIEVRFPIYKWFGGVAFVDGGYRWNKPTDTDGLLWTAGPGIFLRGPFGQVELDWGYRLNGTPGWGSPYFSIGRSF